MTFAFPWILLLLPLTLAALWERPRVAIAVSGLGAGYFFRNFLPGGEPFALFSAGTIPLSNIAISFKVWAGLFAIFVVLVLLHIDNREE